jgi:hypothetical protein
MSVLKTIALERLKLKQMLFQPLRNLLCIMKHYIILLEGVGACLDVISCDLYDEPGSVAYHIPSGQYHTIVGQ